MGEEVNNQQNAAYSSIDKAYERKAAVTRIVPAIKQGLLVLWSIVDIILVFGIFIFFVIYLIQGAFTEKGLVGRIGQNQGVIRSSSVAAGAESLAVSNAKVFSGVEGRYDLYAQVSNPNEKWIAYFDYYFRSSRGDTDVRRGYVLPRRDFEALALSQGDGTGRPGSADLVVENIQWERVRGIPDIEEWISVREEFDITNVNHEGTQVGNQNIVQTSFDIKNDTPYSFWDVDVVIRLEVGSSVVGVNQIRIPQISSSEALSQIVNWYASTSAGATPIIIPQINFFDETIYKETEGSRTGEVLERL